MISYAIVGNGVAGLRAAELIRKNDRYEKITLLSDEPYPFYYRPQLADFIGGSAKESSLGSKQGFL